MLRTRQDGILHDLRYKTPKDLIRAKYSFEGRVQISEAHLRIFGYILLTKLPRQ